VTETLASRLKKSLSAYNGSSKNLQNMKKRDDSWNPHELETFRKYHAKGLAETLIQTIGMSQTRAF
jgi:hypothetical protein